MTTADSIIAQATSTDHAEIVWLDPKTTPKRVRSHRSLEAAIRRLKGKHAATIANELRLVFDRFLRNGHFSLNRRVLDAVHGCRVRKQLMELVGCFSEVVKGHSPNHQAKQRVFTLPGLKKASKKRPTYNGTGDCLEVSREWRCWRMIEAEWMWERYQKWSQWCTENGLEQRLDFSGTTDWGKATLDSLDNTAVPTETASDKPAEGQAHLDKLTKHGVLRMVRRKHGRQYHALTNMVKADRKRVKVDDQRGVEVDLHACYWCVLASWLLPEERQQLVADLQSGDFYRPFEPLYDAFAIAKRAEMQAAGCSPEEIAERLKGAKAEVQRQCLFARDSRPESRPLLAELERRYPALAKLIFRLRLQHGVTGLSHMLTSAEGILFVSTAIPALHRAGVNVIGIHDGLIVPEQHAEFAKRTIERVAYRQLGFVPCVKISQSSKTGL